jgi:hypothetical protein
MALPPCIKMGITAEREYQIKAVYLYNLAKFIIWPNQKANKDAIKSNFLICSLNHTLANEDIKSLSGRILHNRIINVRIINKSDKIPKVCKIVFIPHVYNKLASVMKLNTEEYSSILTVGDSDEFLHNDGLIALVSNGNRIKLKVNLTTAKQRDFKLSANLLAIAEIIE